MHNILLKIIDKKKEDIKKLEIMKHESRSNNKKTLIHNSLFMIPGNEVAIIAEVKFASPTNPNLGSREKLLDRVKKYEDAGADAISIITEKHFFKGDTKFISQVKKEVDIPVLQKDFVIDKQQIYESKNIGSDALLLIAKLVDKKTLEDFVELCFSLEVEPVVEVNNEEDLEKAIITNTNIIAVNARNLENFEIDVEKACKLIKKIPDKFIKLGFSGINSRNEVEKYKKAGAKGVLIGTSLMRTKNIKEFIEGLKL